MAEKLYDLAVKVDEYTDRSTGQQKAKWQNVGAVMKKDDGGKFILLDRHFNPAGVANPDNRTNVLLSMFPPKDRQTAQQSGGSGGNVGQDPAGLNPETSSATMNGRPPQGPPSSFEDDIPF